MMMALIPFLPLPVTQSYLVEHPFRFAGEHADLQIPIPTAGLLVGLD